MMTLDIPQLLQGLLSKGIAIESFSGQEEDFARFLKATMRSLGYDHVEIDPAGNVIGRIGFGEEALLFDGHMDTVLAEDLTKWEVYPYEGAIVDGVLHGRGSVDMKGGLLCAVYAGAMAKEYLPPERSIYITGTVDEEYADGASLQYLLSRLPVKPVGVVVCEPSDNQVMLGHYGKALVEITVAGRAAHGSAPQDGLNAIYQAAPIIEGVAQLAKVFSEKGQGTLALSHIESQEASLNAVPHGCKLVLDWRLSFGASEAQVGELLNELVEGRGATWRIMPMERTTWTGKQLRYDPFHAPWQIDEQAPLSCLASKVYQDQFPGQDYTPQYWKFSTNAVASVAMDIPTIGFGPGDPKLAHQPNEQCPLSQLWAGAQYYHQVMKRFAIDGLGV